MKDLKQVFRDTLNHAQYNFKSRPVTIKYTFNDILKKVYKDDEEGYLNNIHIINNDTVSSATQISERGKTCILNMASYKRPGGGVVNGAKAQEEGLFRCSNLAIAISSKHYPLQDNECLYTNDAIFFKNKYYNYMVPITVDVVTIAAVNLNGSNDIKNYEELTKNKIRLMLSIPLLNGVKNIILGAWGCGVFKNDPETMAQFFSDILIGEGYAKNYKNVIFAIINDHNSVGDNYDIFSNKFNKK